MILVKYIMINFLSSYNILFRKPLLHKLEVVVAMTYLSQKSNVKESPIENGECVLTSLT